MTKKIPKELRDEFKSDARKYVNKMTVDVGRNDNEFIKAYIAGATAEHIRMRDGVVYINNQMKKADKLLHALIDIIGV